MKRTKKELYIRFQHLAEMITLLKFNYFQTMCGYCAERAPLHRGLRPADHCLSEPRPARQAGKPGTVNLAMSVDNCFVLNHLFR